MTVLPIAFASFTGNSNQPMNNLDDLVVDPTTAAGYVQTLRRAAIAAGFSDAQICYPLWAGWRNGQQTWPARQWSSMLPHLKDIARGWNGSCHSICVGGYYTPGPPSNLVDDNNKRPVDANTDEGKTLIEQEWVLWARYMLAGYVVIDRGQELPNQYALAAFLNKRRLSLILNGLPLHPIGKRADGSDIFTIKPSSFQSLVMYEEEMNRIDPEQALRPNYGQVCHVIVHPTIADADLASLKQRGFVVGSFVDPNDVNSMSRVIAS